MAGLKATVKWGKGGGGGCLFKDIFWGGVGTRKKFYSSFVLVCSSVAYSSNNRSFAWIVAIYYYRHRRSEFFLFFVFFFLFSSFDRVLLWVSQCFVACKAIGREEGRRTVLVSFYPVHTHPLHPWFFLATPKTRAQACFPHIEITPPTRENLQRPGNF